MQTTQSGISLTRTDCGLESAYCRAQLPTVVKYGWRVHT